MTITLQNILTTAGEILFIVMLLIMFFNQDKLVKFEKRAAAVIRVTAKTAVRRLKRYIRIKKAENRNGINKKFIYIPATPSAADHTGNAA